MPVSRPQPSEFLLSLRAQFAARLARLEPAVREYEELTEMLECFGRGPTTSSAAGSLARDRQGTLSGQSPLGTERIAPSAAARGADVRPLVFVDGARREPSERHPSPALARAALELVAAERGLTIPGIAVRLGCLHNPLYAIVGTLEREGRIVREGRGWRATPDTIKRRGALAVNARDQAARAEAG
jgi:hypothetical protein